MEGNVRPWAAAVVLLTLLVIRLFFALSSEASNVNLDIEIQANGGAMVNDVIKPVEAEEEFMKRIEERMKRRKVLLQQKCQELGLANKPLSKSRFFLSKPFKFLFCAVPKSGITNWKKSLHYLNIFDSDYNKTMDEVNFDKVHSTSAKYKKDHVGLPQGTEDYLKLLVVRDPFTRLLSAYFDKLAKATTDKKASVLYVYKQIHKRYGKHSSNESVATFEDFVKYLVDKDADDEIKASKGLTRHWTNYDVICQPCAIDYDIIVHLETIDEDSRYVFKRLNAPPSVHYLGGYSKNETSSTTNEIVANSYQHIDPELLEKLHKKFKDEFELFGYEYDSYKRHYSSVSI